MSKGDVLPASKLLVLTGSPLCMAILLVFTGNTGVLDTWACEGSAGAW